MKPINNTRILKGLCTCNKSLQRIKCIECLYWSLLFHALRKCTRDSLARSSRSWPVATCQPVPYKGNVSQFLMLIKRAK